MKTEERKLFTVYGARLSKNEKFVNVSLVAGNTEDKTREWFNFSVELGDTKKKTKAVIKDGKAYIVIPLLKDDKKQEVDLDEIPF